MNPPKTNRGKADTFLIRATSAISTSVRIRTPSSSFGGCLLPQEHRSCNAAEHLDSAAIIIYQVPHSSMPRSGTWTSFQSGRRVERRSVATSVELVSSATACVLRPAYGPPFACCTSDRPAHNSPKCWCLLANVAAHDRWSDLRFLAGRHNTGRCGGLACGCCGNHSHPK